MVTRLLQQLFGRDRHAVGAQEFSEGGELLAGQGNVPAVAVHLAAVGVEPDAGALQDRWGGRPDPPAQRHHPGGQFGKSERLGQVVVRAEGESGDPIVDVGRGGEHQDPGRRVRLGDRPADLVAMHDGQVTVEHDHVVVVYADAFQGGTAVVRQVDRVRVTAQPLGHRVSEQGFVLDDQDPHASMVTRADVSSP
jgi:hypothetical protein